MSTSLPPASRKFARIGTLLSTAAVALGAVALSGCDDDATKPDLTPSPYLAATSPENVIDNLVTAVELRDPEGYAALFDKDAFVFRLDPVDLQGDSNLPPFWNYDGEAAWSKNCFESTDVRRIELEWNKGPLQELDPENDPEDYSGQGVRKMLITGVHLEVDTNNPANPTDPVIFLVSGDRATFYFKPDPNHLVGGQPTWKIVEWRDIRVEGRPLLVIENTFGSVKNLYR